MPRFLLDTCVLSEIRHPNGDQAVKIAVDAIDDRDLYVSVISFGEIRRGILMLREGRQRATLTDWAETLESVLATQTLDVDLATTRLWAELTVEARKRGRQIPTADGLIAATALRHGLTVLTRNIRDFAPTGVPTVNPWSS
ncbi:type II toxin-antitoxin system VapC family toxin [Aureimonas glaciei]|jgi:predicted nucleic acid-binding protein|uniref:Ribonuclease VapC n=1 Tax=Aureimonas glaciei TaxID=1776957 RepID=A0A917D7Q1_9HYPH|nr:type II toxin-antitoxin system VapC family toxin [Aureimonas glaciei]GGD04469.1 ribonuclease VapC [Aureimonas glaciei]